ncbi:MAG: histidine phosphatase family protein [Solirubrobacterales bacterium]|nr:histidine phosphatase family protein [Solirubrobacterales bacterium]
MRRLFLIRHAPTAATRASAFPVDEPLDEGGRNAATRLQGILRDTDEVFCGPSLRCRQTAEIAGAIPMVEPDLAECDFGSWGGRVLADVHVEEPDATRAWMTDPDARPHGGESLTQFSSRVTAWLDDQAETDGRAFAITHGGVIKAALVHSVAAPVESFWRFDAAPLSVTELHAFDGRWTVSRINCPIAVVER